MRLRLRVLARWERVKVLDDLRVRVRGKVWEERESRRKGVKVSMGIGNEVELI